MLMWMILTLACVMCLCFFYMVHAFGPKVAENARVTDAPEVITYPPAPKVNTFPLQSREPDEPITFLYSGSQATRR
jgi:flagellar basal body-associated protein FliL